ncbi:uncharacterized protein LOC133152617 [Syngnathus typhle]|uniref:uncharacterized protein LOC133152617 n=1 Tax=Syngnathus typhle TaxID=161592 RepID=UPI002A69A9C6|nr:uncharacterized protein LOC133152617 [Syngnathus typhle]
MDVHVVTFIVCSRLIFELFGVASGEPSILGSVVYTRDQLLAWRYTTLPCGLRTEIPKEIRPQRKGCRAGVKCRQRKRRYKLCLPSVIMGNMRSLQSKMEVLTALTRTQREYRECSLMCFTETRLINLSPDSHLSLDGLQVVRADRSAMECGKRRGGGLTVFVNDRWCHPGHVSVKERLCSSDLELLVVSKRPYYLPKEFSHVIAVTVYIPPSVVAATATNRIHAIVSRLQTQHPQSVLLISGDFPGSLFCLHSITPVFRRPPLLYRSSGEEPPQKGQGREDPGPRWLLAETAKGLCGPAEWCGHVPV